MKRELHPCIYILMNKGHKVLYTGVTSNLFKRISEHKQKMISGFTSRYNVTKLVYFEEFNTMAEAIAREKQIKGGSRQKKTDLSHEKFHVKCLERLLRATPSQRRKSVWKMVQRVISNPLAPSLRGSWILSESRREKPTKQSHGNLEEELPHPIRLALTGNTL